MRVSMDLMKHSCFETAEAKVVRVPFHLRLAEIDGVRIAVDGESIEYRPAGIAKRQHSRHVVIRLPGSMVTRAADTRVGKLAAATGYFRFHMVEDRVTTRNDQTDRR